MSKERDETAGAADCAIAQPMPGNHAGYEVLPLVISDLRARAAAGLLKYGTALKTGNGRDALVDLYQELLDAAMYARQRIAEGDDAAGSSDLHPAQLRLAMSAWAGLLSLPRDSNHYAVLAGILDLQRKVSDQDRELRLLRDLEEADRDLDKVTDESSREGVAYFSGTDGTKDRWAEAYNRFLVCVERRKQCLAALAEFRSEVSRG